MSESIFETRYELLRPQQLIERRKACPLVILPVGPLEYHGPHLPLGTDAINAASLAHACCRKLRKGVVMPTVYAGTERQREPECLKALGFEPGSYVVGMDFPTRLWNSHYLPEEVFSIIIASELRPLIKQGYRYIFIVNGHGATNQKDVLKKISTELNNTMDVRVGFGLAIPEETTKTGAAGHAGIVETSLLMYYNPEYVDLDTLPPRDVPIRYTDFSIVDGAGFGPDYDTDHIVRDDPRDANAERGRKWFEMAVGELSAKIQKLISQD